MPDYVKIEKGLGPEGRIAVVRFDRGDHRIVACGRKLAFAAKDRWRGSLVKAVHGDASGVRGAARLW